jgi:hypothetical protein
MIEMPRKTVVMKMAIAVLTAIPYSGLKLMSYVTRGAIGPESYTYLEKKEGNGKVLEKAAGSG